VGPGRTFVAGFVGGLPSAFDSFSHEHDGDWQFPSGTTNDTPDGRIACLVCALVTAQKVSLID